MGLTTLSNKPRCYLRLIRILTRHCDGFFYARKARGQKNKNDK